MYERDVVITMHCIFCGNEHEVKVNENDYLAWGSGMLAQNAFPYLSATEREQLISHICPICQAKLFGEEE